MAKVTLEILLPRTIVVLVLLVQISQVKSYCWQLGWNPGFNGPPKVEQIALDRVRVSWEHVVKNRHCADQFLVKFWPRASPVTYSNTDLVPPDQNYIDIEVVPKIPYQFQAVAREDKGTIGGIDWNKSPVVEFKTSNHNVQIDPDLVEKRPRTNVIPAYEKELSADTILRSGEYETTYTADDPIRVAGFSLEVFVAMIVGSIITCLIIVGLIYKFTCGKNKSLDDDEDDDDDEMDNDPSLDRKLNAGLTATMATPEETEDLSPERNIP